MQDLKAKVGSVEDITPAVDHMTLGAGDGLVEVEAVEVERHGRHTQRSKPDPDHRQSCKEEVKRA